MNRLFRRAALWLQARFNDFDPAAGSYPADLVDGPLAPILILAPPRTGTTLLYQVLLQQLHLAFISNLVSALPRYMVRMAGRWPGLVSRPPREIKRGHYGFVPGLLAPSEAGKVMDRWFSDPVVASSAESIRRTLSALGRISNGPVLIKSLSLTHRLPQVGQVLPRARYIRLRRALPYTVQSVLLGRADPSLGADRWQGVEPEGLDARKERGPIHEAALIVRAIDRRIDEHLAGCADRVIEVEYERFCSAPAETVERLARVFLLERRNPAAPLPPSFPSANRVRVDAPTWARIRDETDAT